MWSKTVFSVACYGLFSVICALTTDTSDIPKLKLLCGRGNITQGMENTIKSICRSNYSVMAPEISTIPSDKFPLMFVSYIKDDSGQESSRVEMEINSPTDLMDKDNITKFVPVGVMALSGSTCSIRGASVHFELESTDGALLYQAQVKRRIWCDNSDVDLAMQVTGGETPTIYLDGINSLMTALSGSNVEVVAKNLGGDFQEFVTEEGKVPLGIFAAAFVTKYRKGMPLTETECLNNVNHSVPEITDKDIIVAHELFTANADLPSTKISDLVKLNDDELDICGDYVLVLLIDVLNTLGNEGNRCNNFVTFRINSTKKCDSVHPRCELIRNAWTDGEARIVYRGKRDTTMEPYGKSFSFQDEKLEEVYESMQEKMYMKNAYGRLKLLRHYIEKLVENSPGLCTESSDMVHKMEENADDSVVPEENEPTLPSSVLNVIEKLKQLSDPSVDSSTIVLEFENALKQLEAQTTVGKNLYEMLVHKMEIHALGEALHVISEGGSTTDTKYCDLPGRFEEIQWKYTDAQDIQEDMFNLAGDTVSAFVSNPGLSCLEKILKRFLMFAEKADASEVVDPAYLTADDESVAKEDDLTHCAKPSRCIKKLHRMCNARSISIWQEIDEESKSEICKMYVMKKVAKESFMTLGMPDIYNKMKHYDDVQCNRDPLKPDQAGPPTYWKEMTENGRKYIMHGMMNEDASKIAWRKKAVCSCTECVAGGMTGESGGETPTEGGNDGMMRKRRK